VTPPFRREDVSAGTAEVLPRICKLLRLAAKTDPQRIAVGGTTPAFYFPISPRAAQPSIFSFAD